MEGYDGGDSRLGLEGGSLRRVDIKVANQPKQVKSVAIDDRAAVESTSVVADRDLDADAGTTDDMHENMSALSSVVSMLHRVGQQLVGHPQHGCFMRDRADTIEPQLKLHGEFLRATAGQNPLAMLAQQFLKGASPLGGPFRADLDDSASEDQRSGRRCCRATEAGLADVGHVTAAMMCHGQTLAASLAVAIGFRRRHYELASERPHFTPYSRDVAVPTATPGRFPSATRAARFCAIALRSTA